MEERKLNLTDFRKIPLKTEEFVKTFGKTLVVAPHPDDESLACGGIIALLRNYDLEVSILVLSDGTLSHPNSKKFPKEKLRDLREKELLDAAKILDVEDENITFLRFQDRSVPDKNSANFAMANGKIEKILKAKNPQTIFVPWRRDPHPDHRAAFELINTAKNANHAIIEYPIWLYELATSNDAPLKSEVSAFRIDINSVVEKKQKAILAHTSQVSNLIDDDPDGFKLSAETLQKFAVPFELFLVSNE